MMKPAAPLTLFLFLAAFLTLSSLRPAARAAESGWASADHIKARLIAAAAPAQEGPDRFQGMFDVALEDGWHAYWRMPGDGGIAPQLDWQKSENAAAIKLSWPAPKRFVMAGLNSFGYEHDFALPFTFTRKEAGKNTVLRVKASIMICKDICLPQEIALELGVPAEDKGDDSGDAAAIRRAFEKVPADKDMPGLQIKSVVLGPQAMAVTVFVQKGADAADLFVETGKDFYLTAAPEITVTGKDKREGLLRLAAPEGSGNLAKSLAGAKVTLTLTDGTDAISRDFSF
jgi:suppressor for copper-sensitivity B